MSNLPPELVKKLKELAVASMGETAKLLAQRIVGMNDPARVFQLIKELMPNLPGVPPQVLLIEKYILINILGRSKIISDELYTGLLKEVNPIVEMQLV